MCGCFRIGLFCCYVWSISLESQRIFLWLVGVVMVLSTQPCIRPGLLNRVPASAWVKAGKSPLPGGRYNTVWSHMACDFPWWGMVKFTNCYTLFTYLLCCVMCHLCGSSCDHKHAQITLCTIFVRHLICRMRRSSEYCYDVPPLETSVHITFDAWWVDVCQMRCWASWGRAIHRRSGRNV